LTFFILNRAQKSQKIPAEQDPVQENGKLQAIYYRGWQNSSPAVILINSPLPADKKEWNKDWESWIHCYFSRRLSPVSRLWMASNMVIDKVSVIFLK